MTDFDPESLTWRVFVTKVREEHGHAFVPTGLKHARCTHCALTMTIDYHFPHGFDPGLFCGASAKWCPRVRTRSRA